MKPLFLTGILLALFSIAAPVFASEDASLYTPAELRRNAQREALGLPPLEPKATRKRKKIQPASRKSANLKGRKPGMAPFSTPAQSSTGYVAIHRDHVGGLLLGYLNTHKIVPTVSMATEYTYTSGKSVIEIYVANTDSRMCIATGLYGKQLESGLKNFHHPRHSELSTRPGDLPLHDPKTASYIESTVFVIDPETGEIEIEWVNPDGSRPPVQIALKDERIYYTGDIQALRKYLTDRVHVDLVVFKWVPYTDFVDSTLGGLLGS